MGTPHKVLFIAGIERLQVSSDLERGEKIGESLRITNDESVIRELLTPDFHSVAGSLEASALPKSGAVLYSVDECSPFVDEQAGISFLNERLGEAQVFLQMLWFVKDNSATVEAGYLEHPYKGYRPRVSRNFIPSLYSTARGEYVAVEFSREELRKARGLFQVWSPSEFLWSPHVTVEIQTRLARGFYFLQGARARPDLGLKIATYCTCLEALFSTDTQELSHKLAERIACFLETGHKERIKVFNDVKTAYGIRSKIIHGAGGSQRMRETIGNASVSLDEILRRVLLRIVATPSISAVFAQNRTGKDIEDYFLSLVLGASSREDSS